MCRTMKRLGASGRYFALFTKTKEVQLRFCNQPLSFCNKVVHHSDKRKNKKCYRKFNAKNYNNEADYSTVLHEK